MLTLGKITLTFHYILINNQLIQFWLRLDVTVKYYMQTYKRKHFKEWKSMNALKKIIIINQDKYE